MLDFAGAGFFVQILRIALFANFQRSVYENLQEIRSQQPPGLISFFTERGDQGDQGYDIRIQEQLGYMTYSPIAFPSVVFRKTEIVIEPTTDIIAVQQIGDFSGRIEIVFKGAG